METSNNHSKTTLWKTQKMKFLKRFVRKAKNLISWFSVIFKDENWDHVYIYIILQHKLKRTLKGLEDFKYCDNISAKRHLKICIKLLDRIIQDDFYDDSKKFYTYEEIMKTDASLEILEDVGRRYKKSEMLRKKYIKTLFHILENRIEWFWC